nr:hypothetical protein [Tanacetum cinerariifolium]
TFMPHKLNLVFHNAHIANETVLTVLNVKPNTTKPNKDLSQSNRHSAPIIEDWVSNSKDESEGYLLRQLSILSQLKTLGKTFPSLTLAATPPPPSTTPLPPATPPKPPPPRQQPKQRKGCLFAVVNSQGAVFVARQQQ